MYFVFVVLLSYKYLLETSGVRYTREVFNVYFFYTNLV